MTKKVSEQRSRRSHSTAFKATVALAALREDKTTAELCNEFKLHPTQVRGWKRRLLEQAADVFGTGSAPKHFNLDPLQAKVDQLVQEIGSLENTLADAGLLGPKRGRS